MEDEKLIDCVRNYEFLYNLQHPKFRDNRKKEMAWKEISGQLKQPAAACKHRWQGLRDAYRRALNKKKSKSGQAARKIKKWKYEEEMSFVASFFVEKQTIKSFKQPRDDEEEPYSKENNITNAVDMAASHYTESNKDDTIVRNKSLQLQHSQSKKAIKKAKTLLAHSASAVLISRLLDEQVTIPYDELDRFFLNISETVKKFSPYLQAMVKNKIFRLVSEMELQQLASPIFATNDTSTSSCAKANTTPTPTSPET